MSQASYVEVRCPSCRRLAAEADTGARLRVKCARCHELFEVTVSAT
jgi:phage FluMu protein Com